MSERCVVEGCGWKLPPGDSCPDHPTAIQSPAEPEEAGSPPATKELPKSDPFDKSPNPLTPATNGYVKCRECEQVVQLPHDCTREVDWKATAEVGRWCLDDWRERAEEAEAEVARLRMELGRVVANSSEATDAGAIARDALKDPEASR